GLDILCRNLASSGLLVKSGGRYRNGPMARRALNAKSPDSRGAYLDLVRGHWDAWSQLTRSVKRGRPVDDDKPDNPKYRRAFTWAMHHRTRTTAPLLATELNLKSARTLLDLGGGPGTYALAFLAENPKLAATLCDRPEALQVAKQIAASSRHGRRLSYLARDFMNQPVPGRYDVIWLSNVVHIYSPAENQRLLKKLAGSLAPHGRLFVQDMYTHDRNGLYPQDTNLFAVTMLLFTDRGNTYSTREVKAWLTKAGFGQVRRLKFRAGSEAVDADVLEASRLNAHRGTRTRRHR
ncbi:MAG: methyltransferase, partial [Nitrospiraceae bacterium]